MREGGRSGVGENVTTNTCSQKSGLLLLTPVPGRCVSVITDTSEGVWGLVEGYWGGRGIVFKCCQCVGWNVI